MEVDLMMEWMEKYREQFGITFPSYQFMGLGEDGVIEIIKECLDAGKTPYDLGYLERDIEY